MHAHHHVPTRALIHLDGDLAAVRVPWFGVLEALGFQPDGECAARATIEVKE